MLGALTFLPMLLPILFRTTSVISSNTVLTKACANGVFGAVENCGRVTLQAAPPSRQTWPRYRIIRGSCRSVRFLSLSPTKSEPLPILVKRSRGRGTYAPGHRGAYYVSGLFVDDSLGTFPGTLPLSAIDLKGSALTPMPAIAVNFRTFGCENPLLCTVEIADTALQQGQGMHGSFSRAETMVFMAAIGPDFKAAFRDQAPASNADVGKTLAKILGLKIQDKGKLVGRVLTEAMPGGDTPKYVAKACVPSPRRTACGPCWSTNLSVLPPISTLLAFRNQRSA